MQLLQNIKYLLLFLVQSVHFDDIEDLVNNTDTSPAKSIEQVLDMIRNSRQRNLNEWYFAENFEPKILVQVSQLRNLFLKA